MNYILQIKAFYDRLEVTPLTLSAISMWHGLMFMCNRLGWPEEFSLAAHSICARSGLSERTLTNARNELKTKGLIDFKSRRGNQSAIYKIHVLYENLSAIDADKFSDNVSDKFSDNVSALFKHKPKHKLSPTTASASANNIFVAFENEGFGTLSDIIGQKLGDLSDTYSERWVFEAMKEAVISGKRNLGYVHAILRRWQAEGIDSPWERRNVNARPKATFSRSTSETELFSL